MSAVPLRQFLLFGRLTPATQSFLEELAQEHQFTYQEQQYLINSARDLEQWGEEPLPTIWRQLAKNQSPEKNQDSRRGKKQLLAALQEQLLKLRRAAKQYPLKNSKIDLPREREIKTDKTTALKLGRCPVYSPKTVCCGLYTLDTVQNCPSACSYCTIQTFYDDYYLIHENLADKLAALDLDPQRCYHIGTGQASDALAWGNDYHQLEALSTFAARHPHVLLELKSKQSKVAYFEQHPPPPNLICSWTLNSKTIIENEEHGTASLAERLAAARRVVAIGSRVAFHFHPLVYYAGWEAEYRALAKELITYFKPKQIAFISLGVVTLIKPALKAIRARGRPTKITQMDFNPDPHGRLSYPDEIKIQLYQALYQALAPWHQKVFIYLCMEKAEIWQQALGHCYPDNESFENAFKENCVIIQ